MSSAKQEMFVEQLASSLSGDTLSLIGKSRALEYDVKTLLINAVRRNSFIVDTGS